jgi:hypothetical protein
MTQCVMTYDTTLVCRCQDIPERSADNSLTLNDWRSARPRGILVFDTHFSVVAHMAVFRDATQLYDTIGALMDQAKADPIIGPKIAKSKLVVQFRYAQPDAVTTLSARGTPSQPGAFVEVVHGPCELRPDVILSMSADIAHAFWQGRVNLVAAISRKEILAQGPIVKVLKLLPAVEPLYKVYPALLRERGYGELIAQDQLGKATAG